MIRRLAIALMAVPLVLALADTAAAQTPEPTLDVTVDRFVTFDQAGVATVTGTFTCANADFADIIDITGSIRQSVGRFTIVGTFGFIELATFTCDGTAQTWSAVAVPENGTFRGGKATVIASGTACDFDDFQVPCAIDFGEPETVQLRGSSN
jgi:hypothetical protein